jgi:hypothetical protein
MTSVISPVYSNKQVEIILLIEILKYNTNPMRVSFKSYFANEKLCTAGRPPVRTPFERVYETMMMYKSNIVL